MGIKVFYSYAHEDMVLRDELEKHLSILKRQGKIANWHYRDIKAGKEWVREIDTNLNLAHIILLLVSADFLASDYCYSIEMKRALERHEKGEARVIPIILRSVDWAIAPFSKLQALPTNGKAIRSWTNLDEAFSDVAIEIRKAVDEIITSHRELQAEAQFAVNNYTDSYGIPSMTFTKGSILVDPLQRLLELERQRQDQLLSLAPSRSLRVDKDLIVCYDLETQMAKLKEQLNFGGAFAFTLGGYNHILKHYIIERMCREVKEKMQRNHKEIDIYLYPEDIQGDIQRIIYKKVVKESYSTILEVFKEKPKMDVVLIIWNCRVPMTLISETATFFWEEVTHTVMPFLQAQNQCFIVILANVDARARVPKIDKFTPIRIPSEFEITSLVQWFKGRLEDLGVLHSDVEYCLNTLKDQHGTYDAMENVVSYLQGRYSS